MHLLVNPIRNYAWGSRTAIATLQGRPAPTELPEAELWMGTHPSAPSLVAATGLGAAAPSESGPGPGLVPLTQVIADDPITQLGAAVNQRFGGRLPFLLKVLAAAQPLSLQVHPDAAQARAGFAAEQAAGVPLDAPGRNYVDPYHKPELLVALEEFEALCGFRDPQISASVIESLGVPALQSVVAALRSGTVPDRLRQGIGLLTGWPEANRPAVLAAVIAAARQALAQPASDVAAQGYGLVVRLGQLYPTDIGVVIALLLHQVQLRPDQAVFLPAGNLHAYVRGVGIEVMAASDNVLRGGLTPKHVDVAELVRILRFEVHEDPVVQPEVIDTGVVTWPAPVSEFSLVKATVREGDGSVVLPGGGPRVVVCVAGAGRLSTGGGVIQVIRRGESVFVSAADPSVALTGEAVVFQASPC